jgi:hypothetical protein
MTDKTIWSWREIAKNLGIKGTRETNMMQMGRAIALRHFDSEDLEKDDVIAYIKDIASVDATIEEKLIIALSQWDYLTADWGVNKNPHSVEKEES